MSLELLDAVPLTSLSGVGLPFLINWLKSAFITCRIYSFHLPIRYEDRTRITPIANLRPEQYFTIEGIVQTCEVVLAAARFYR